MFAETATSRSVCLVLRSADLMATEWDCRVFCSLTAANLELEISYFLYWKDEKKSLGGKISVLKNVFFFKRNGKVTKMFYNL